MIRVLIAEDQVLLRGSIRLLLEVEDDMDVVCEAGTGREAVEGATRHRPDVALMDIRMPELDGIEATRQISSSADTAEVRVLVLTTFDHDEYVYSALRAGASGFLLKDTPPTELLDAIRVVSRGDALLAPSVTRRLIADFAARPAPSDRTLRSIDDLTARESEVLEVIAHGLSNDEISEQLHISPATVKTHISHLLLKLHARDRAQLVIAAYESGLVRPRSSE